MARGMAAGEPVNSQAATDEFREGYARAFGDRKPERGRWVMDPQTKQLVRAEDYVPPSRAVDAPILSGRFYENTATLEGEDIGSRAKYQEYCRRKGVTNMSDFSDAYYQRIHAERKQHTAKVRREAIKRAVWEKFER